MNKIVQKAGKLAFALVTGITTCLNVSVPVFAEEEETRTATIFIDHVVTDYTSGQSPVYGASVTSEDTAVQLIDEYWMDAEGSRDILFTAGESYTYVVNLEADADDCMYILNGETADASVLNEEGTLVALKEITIPESDPIEPPLPEEIPVEEPVEETVEEVPATTFAAAPLAVTYTESGFSTVSKMSPEQLFNLYESIGTYTTLYATAPVLSSGNYKPAVLTQEAYNTAKDWINYYRKSIGLTSVTFNSNANTAGGYGALVDAAYGDLDHYPKQPSDMDDDTFSKGYAATTTSNLSWSYGISSTSVLARAISGQMEDSDPGNIVTLGHRRWLINPSLGSTGIGCASIGSEYYTDVPVFHSSVTSQSVPDYSFIAWPASGNNLSDTFFNNTPWSVTLNPSKYAAPSASSVKVTLTRKSDGKVYTFTNSDKNTDAASNYMNVNNSGYSVANCIIFRPAYSDFSKYSGDYEVCISGLKDSAGAATELNYKVHFDNYAESAEKIDISQASVTLTPNHYTYNGSWCMPDVVVTCNGKVLSNGTDYSVMYYNGIGPGTAYAEITGKGRYTGTARAYYTIEAGTVSLSSASVTLSSSTYTYDGTAKKPTVTVTVNGTTLTSGTDYTVSYASNINAGTATVTVTGKGNYTGTVTRSFTINKAGRTFSYDIPAYIQSGTTVTATASLIDDYTVSSSNSSILAVSHTAGTNTIQLTADGVGTYTVTLTPKNSTNYSDPSPVTVSVQCIPSFSIVDLKDITVSAGDSFTLNATIAGSSALSTVDHTWQWYTQKGTASPKLVSTRTNNNAYTATMTSDLSGTKIWCVVTDEYGFSETSNTVTIRQADLITIPASSVSLYTGTGYVYDGSAKKPSVTVTVNGTRLTENTDYTVTYSNNVNAGTASVTVTGTDVKYTGTVTKTFTIRKAAQSYSISGYHSEMHVGDNALLSLSYYNTPTCTSSDSNVLKVVSTSHWEAVGAGTATITYVYPETTNYLGATSTIDVTVYPIVEITSQPKSVAGPEGKNVSFTVEAKPSNVTYQWQSKPAGSSTWTDISGAASAAYSTTISKTNNGSSVRVKVSDGHGMTVESQEAVITLTEKTPISDAAITLGTASYTYDGTAKKPSVTVKMGTKTLISGTDYTVAYTNNTNAGTATVTITGIGSYAGTAAKTFTIQKASSALTATIPTSVTAGSTASITASAKTGITYSSNNTSVLTVDSTGKMTGVKAGTAAITVTSAGTGNYNSETKTVTVTVTAASSVITLTDGNVTLGTDYYVYDGTAKKPAVTVTVNGTKLTSGTDYTAAYANNINAGTATVTVTGKGKYTGTVKKNFEIARAFPESTISYRTTGYAGSTGSITIDSPVKWLAKSSNPAVAAVSVVSSQLVTVNYLKAGTTTITLYVNDANYEYDELTINVTVYAMTGVWKKDNTGWWYRYSDGSYPKNTWAQIDGKMYHFNAAGYMQTGWLKDNGSWYYLTSSGAMATGWLKINGTYYYFYNDGRMAESTWVGNYYLKSSGAMAVGWLQIDGSWYYFQSSGAKKTGWLQSGSTWYYMESSGKMVTGFRTIGSATYYFKSSGAMATGWVLVGSDYYYFESSGAMAKSKWVGNYYLKENGVMARSEWIGKYHVDANGKWDATK